MKAHANAAVLLAMILSSTPALAQCVEPPRQSLSGPFTNMLHDLGRLPSGESLGWLAAGSLVALGARDADASVTRSLSRSQSLHDTLKAGAIVGGAPLQLGAAVTTFAIGRALKSPCAITVGADLIRAQLLSQTLTIGVKQAVRRTRPGGAGLSFPSGHTAISFASATVLQQHFGWKVGVPAYAVASYVAASRIQMKRHYLSDVAFGAALGILSARIVTLGRGRLWQMEPVAVPGGTGIAISWIGKR